MRDCLATLSDTIAGLSFGVFRKVDSKRREAVPDHPIAKLMLDPSPEMTSYEFLASLVDDLASTGNFYGRAIYRRSYPIAIERFEPKYATLQRLMDKSRRLTVSEPGLPQERLVEGEFWHIPRPPIKDKLVGRSPILDDGVASIGAAIAVQDYAAEFFNNDATPPFVFKHPGAFGDPASKENFLNAWLRWMRPGNRHRPAVLEYGMEVQTLSSTNEESQFLETRAENNHDCARIWAMPPHKVGLMDKATFTNIEHQGLEFVTDTIGPWLELIERSINKWLIGDPRFYFEFNVASLLRGDIETRFNAYAVGRQWGWISVNEIRALENMNGIGPAGDRYLTPLNMEEHEPGARAPQGPARDSVHHNLTALRSALYETSR